MLVSLVRLKTIRCFPNALQIKFKLFTGAYRPCMVWFPPIPTPNLISLHSPAWYIMVMLASFMVLGHTAPLPAQGAHLCCSPCLACCSSCSLHSWPLLILRFQLQCLSSERASLAAPPALPPVTSVTSPVCSLIALTMLWHFYLYTCLIVYILSASQKCKLHETWELVDCY